MDELSVKYQMLSKADESLYKITQVVIKLNTLLESENVDDVLRGCNLCIRLCTLACELFKEDDEYV